MRKLLVLALIVAMTMLVGAYIAFAADGTQNDSVTNFGTTAGTGINETVHDLSRNLHGINYVAMPADPLQRICIFCHAPHNTVRLSTAPGGTGPQANAAFTYLPLWNHELTANFGSYTMYENGDMPVIGAKASQAILQGMTQPGGVSLLCLSCHDGTVSVNSYGNTDQPSYSQSSGGPTMGAGYVIGQDNYLGNHHPIGFDYDQVIADGDNQIRSADLALFNATDSVRNHLFSGTNGPSLYMECATCHAVHNTGNTGESLLYRSDTQSQFCLTCHIKGTDPTGTFDAQAPNFIP